MFIEDLKIGTQVFEDVIGKTYLGEDRKTGKTALVKILHPVLAEQKELARAFQEGAATSRRLTGQHFCQTLSHGTQHDRHYVVLRHFDHIQLATILKREHVLSIFDAPGVVEKLAIALRTLHLSGEVHGAISPDCVFFTKTLDSARICNFGYEKLIRLLIKARHPGLESSIRYFSPELTTGQRHLHRQSDVYSLGVLFYRLLVGNAPWQSTQFDDFFSGKRRRSIIPPSLRRLEIPDALDSVIMQAVEENVDDRCANLSLFIQKISGERANILATLTPTTAFVFNDVDPPPTSAMNNGKGPDEDEHRAGKLDGDESASLKRDTKTTQPAPQFNTDPDGDSDLGELSNSNEASPAPDLAPQPAAPEGKAGSAVSEQSEPPSQVLDAIFAPPQQEEPPPYSILSDQTPRSAESIEFREYTQSGKSGNDPHDSQAASPGSTEPIYPEPFGEPGTADEIIFDEPEPSHPVPDTFFEQGRDSNSPASAGTSEDSDLLPRETEAFDEAEQGSSQATQTQIEEPAFDFGETTRSPSSVESTFATDATLSVGVSTTASAPEKNVAAEHVAEINGGPADYLTRETQDTPALRDELPADSDDLFLEPEAMPELPGLQNDEFDDHVLNLMRRDSRPAKGYENGTTRSRNGNGGRERPESAPLAASSNGTGAAAMLTASDESDGTPRDMIAYDEDYSTTHTVDIERSGLSGWSAMTFARILLVTILPLTLVLLVLTFSVDLDFSEGLDGLKDGFFPNSSQKTQALRGRQLQKRPSATRAGARRQGNRANSLARDNRRSATVASRQKTRQQSTAGSQRRAQASAPRVNAPGFSSSGSQVEAGRRGAPATQTVQLTLLVQNAGSPLQANVFVDGSFVGRTNQRGIIVIPGLSLEETYLVKVELSGFQVWANEFVATGPGISNLVAELTALTTRARSQNQQAVVTPRQPAARRSPTPSDEARNGARNVDRSPARQSGPGKINVVVANVESLSDAYIYLNGSLWNGRNYTAPAQLELPAGTYVIEIRKEGYVSAPPSYTVNIINGETKTITFILTAN